jgi:MSHA biogenesis protein MshK
MKPLLLFLLFGIVCAQASTLQDPTKPSPNKMSANNGQDSSLMLPMPLKLTAIIKTNQNKQAIINGKSFQKGQQVQGYKIISISQNHVLLKGSDGQQTLYVNNSNIKKDSNNGF